MRFQETICFSAAMALLGVGCGAGGATRDRESRTVEESSRDADFSPAQGPISGAIWTTDPTGERADANIYTAKTDVYLNGGPARPGAAGLPDGDYYYQITDPGCKELLAGPNPSASGIPDTSAKLITVINGETDPRLTEPVNEFETLCFYI